MTIDWLLVRCARTNPFRSHENLNPRATLFKDKSMFLVNLGRYSNYIYIHGILIYGLYSCTVLDLQ